MSKNHNFKSPQTDEAYIEGWLRPLVILLARQIVYRKAENEPANDNEDPKKSLKEKE